MAVFFMVKLIETPRDGFQGLSQMIPTSDKVNYINNLLKVGFDAIDVGSFVSNKAIPQMADTADIIHNLDWSSSKSKLMVLVANEKGAELAAGFSEISQIIYPFSISPTFLKKNINSDFKKSEKVIDRILNISIQKNKESIIYLAMGFGNPFDDPWSIDLIHEWVDKLVSKGVHIIPISDITGESTASNITTVYSSLINAFPEIEFGFHLHAKADDWLDKVNAAYEAGCRRFDSVLGGMGGCPMTGYELLSNLDTENLISFLENKNEKLDINKKQLLDAKKSLKRLL